MILGVNGRFLGARVTGVQRFAAEITGRLWPRLERGVLLLPAGVEPPRDHPGNVSIARGRLAGVPWERLELPRAARRAGCDVLLSPASSVPLAGGPHVVILHDVEPLLRPESFSRSFVAWWRLGVAPAVRRAARVVTSSRVSADEIAAVIGVERWRIRVAQQGAAPFDRPADAGAVAAMRARLGLEGPYLLAVGGGDPRKNVAFARAVLARWREREPGAVPALVVVTGGQERIFSPRMASADPAEIDVGRVDDETLRALYTGAAALVFPSLSEGFGRPPLEALACGTPALTATYPVAEEVLGDAADRLPLDPDAWVDRLIALTREDLAARAARLARARTQVAAHSWDAGAGAVLAACGEVAEEVRPVRAGPASRGASQRPPPVAEGPFAGLRVAVVHDWLMSMRGGERLLEHTLAMFPGAELFTLAHRRGEVSAAIEARRIHTSFIQRLPLSARHYRWYLPLFPRAIESFDFTGFDLVVSSSTSVAKGAMTRGVPHLCYCNTPMRYAWDQYDAYFGAGRAPLPLRLTAGAVARSLREWDRKSADRVHLFVANSNNVRERIRRAYDRDSRVVYPAVDVDRFTPAARRDDFYLIVSAMVPYKRIDVAIEALGGLGRPLVVVGSGPELPRLRALAVPHVRFMGWLGDEEVADLMSRCRALLMPGVEDFGLVPVEAQAAGAPVIALGKGGVLETVLDVEAGPGGTGVFFAEPTVVAIRDAVLRFEQVSFDPEALRRNALRFHPDRFREGMTAALGELLGRSVERALSR